MPEGKTLVLVVVLIAATAVFLTLVPVLRRSSQGAGAPDRSHSFNGWLRERHDGARAAHKDKRGADANEPYDEAEVERLVREQLYGQRKPRR